MASTPEGKVKDAVKKVLDDTKRFGYIHHYWPVPGGFGKPHLDCIGCYRGEFFAIETKRPGKRMTPLQCDTARDVLAAGGAVFEISGDTAALEEWLETCRDTIPGTPGPDHPPGCADRAVPTIS